MSKCIWPTGEHFWSLPQPDGTKTCLWCSAEQQAKPPIDGCTESNCKRCRTHPNHRGDMEHAGIGWRPDSPQEASDV